MDRQRIYDEQELLLQVAAGDEQAFTTLFGHWHQQLGSYLYRITESRELTEEIVQDVFLKIWMTRETLTEINNFRHFLLVVSRNRAFDVMKKQLREQKQKRTWIKENSQEKIGFHDENPQAEWGTLIDQAIDSLPPRRKQVYLLSRHERLTYNEIAEKLNISRESVKTHLQLAAGSIADFIRPHLLEIGVLILLQKLF